MVSFICTLCNETLKKPKLVQHAQKCPPGWYSCLDCQREFRGEREFKTHTSCITEKEKYEGTKKTEKKGGPGNGNVTKGQEKNTKQSEPEKKQEVQTSKTDAEKAMQKVQRDKIKNQSRNDTMQKDTSAVSEKSDIGKATDKAEISSQKEAVPKTTKVESNVDQKKKDKKVKKDKKGPKNVEAEDLANKQITKSEEPVKTKSDTRATVPVEPAEKPTGSEKKRKREDRNDKIAAGLEKVTEDNAAKDIKEASDKKQKKKKQKKQENSLEEEEPAFHTARENTPEPIESPTGAETQKADKKQKKNNKSKDVKGEGKKEVVAAVVPDDTKEVEAGEPKIKKSKKSKTENGTSGPSDAGTKAPAAQSPKTEKVIAPKKAEEDVEMNAENTVPEGAADKKVKAEAKKAKKAKKQAEKAGSSVEQHASATKEGGEKKKKTAK